MESQNKIKKTLKWFFCIPKENKITKLDALIMLYEFFGVIITLVILEYKNYI